VSPRLFDELVADGRMPKPVRINARVLWDRVQLDAAFAALSDGEGFDDPWSTVST
jgi:predicted DNA-binding transcriptional regulator AlpA